MVETALGRRASDNTRLQRIGQRSGWMVPERVDAPELLDMGVGTPEEVSGSLNDLWRLNRYLGGLRSLTLHLYPRLAALDGVVHCVDIGAGDGRVAAAISRWAQKHGRDVRVTALDLSERNLTRAQGLTPKPPPSVRGLNVDPHLNLLQADATRLPFAEGAVDYFASSLMLHHFTPEAAVGLLRSAYRSARRGLIVCDLMRGYLPLAGFHLVKPLLARSPITRYDGAVSIRRGYTPAELRLLALEAGIANPRVTVHPLWRMTLVADK